MTSLSPSPLVRTFLFSALLVSACSRSTLLEGSGESYHGGGGGSNIGGKSGVGGVSGVGGLHVISGTTVLAGGSSSTVPTDPNHLCQTDADCDDYDDCTIDSCKGIRCSYTLTSGSDIDNDGYAGYTCRFGNDCDDFQSDINPGTLEVCTNGIDDNCNGLIDCEDPDCTGVDGCGACALYETSCTDGRDNDCDGRRDCADTECFLTSACPCQAQETHCSDQMDEDCDGLFDCADPDCSKLSICSCQSKENCSNEHDDDCDGLTDCRDPDCKASPYCTCQTSETNCTDGIDEDCDALIDCADLDCRNTTACRCRLAVEDCSNGVDDNCNDLVDCRDPSCATDPACTCSGGSRKEVCTDGVDNDCDGLPDCMDPDCLTAPICSSCLVTENCNDLTDNDCDGYVDCQDTECLGKADNCRPVAETCNDLKDNDFDGDVDCADTDCRDNDYCKKEHETCITAMTVTASGSFTGTTYNHPVEYVGSCGGHGSEAVFALVISAPSHVTADTIGTTDFDTTLYLRSGVCATGAELACNDDAGYQSGSLYSYAKIELPIIYPGIYYLFVDGFAATDYGVDSGNYIVNISIEPNPKENCSNGRDDDGDVYVDCADPDCRSQARCKCNAPAQAAPEYGIVACTDGIDNDCDGLVDGADKEDCHASSNYPSEYCNGIDDSGNGIIDDFSCRCKTDADCEWSEICYTLIHACASPCDNFVGTSTGGICPAIAAGSVCSNSWSGGSGQCVYP